MKTIILTTIILNGYSYAFFHHINLMVGYGEQDINKTAYIIDFPRQWDIDAENISNYGFPSKEFSSKPDVYSVYAGVEIGRYLNLGLRYKYRNIRFNDSKSEPLAIGAPIDTSGEHIRYSARNNVLNLDQVYNNHSLFLTDELYLFNHFPNKNYGMIFGVSTDLGVVFLEAKYDSNFYNLSYVVDSTWYDEDIYSEKNSLERHNTSEIDDFKLTGNLNAFCRIIFGYGSLEFQIVYSPFDEDKLYLEALIGLRLPRKTLTALRPWK